MRPVLTPPALTREQLIAMQDALINEYSKSLFQERLRGVQREVDGSIRKAAQQARAYRELCKIWEVVGTTFGFEASPEGVAQSIAAFSAKLNTDPDISERNRRMSVLVAPLRHDELGSKRVEALGAWMKWTNNIKERSRNQASAENCTIWRTPVKKLPDEEDSSHWDDENSDEEDREEAEAEEPEQEDEGNEKKAAFMSHMLNLLHKKKQDEKGVGERSQDDPAYDEKKRALHSRMQQLLQKKRVEGGSRASEEDDEEYYDDESDREDPEEMNRPVGKAYVEAKPMSAKDRLQEMLKKAEQATHAHAFRAEEDDDYDEEEDDDEPEESQKPASTAKDRLREMLQRERAK